MLIKYSVNFPYCDNLPPGFESLEGVDPIRACAKVLLFVSDPANPTRELLNKDSAAVRGTAVDCNRYVGAVVGTLRMFDYSHPAWVFEIEIPDEAVKNSMEFQNCFITQARIYDPETQAIYNQTDDGNIRCFDTVDSKEDLAFVGYTVVLDDCGNATLVPNRITSEAQDDIQNPALIEDGMGNPIGALADSCDFVDIKYREGEDGFLRPVAVNPGGLIHINVESDDPCVDPEIPLAADSCDLLTVKYSQYNVLDDDDKVVGVCLKPMAIRDRGLISVIPPSIPDAPSLLDVKYRNVGGCLEPVIATPIPEPKPDGIIATPAGGLVDDSCSFVELKYRNINGCLEPVPVRQDGYFVREEQAAGGGICVNIEADGETVHYRSRDGFIENGTIANQSGINAALKAVAVNPWDCPAVVVAEMGFDPNSALNLEPVQFAAVLSVDTDQVPTPDLGAVLPGGSLATSGDDISTLYVRIETATANGGLVPNSRGGVLAVQSAGLAKVTAILPPGGSRCFFAQWFAWFVSPTTILHGGMSISFEYHKLGEIR